MQLHKKLSASTAASQKGVSRPVRVRLAPARAYVEEKQKGESVATNQLEVLKSMSVVVADTGKPELVKKYKPQVTDDVGLVL
jgi:hypothetical protein